MHKHFMEHYGNYLKENYSDLSRMTKSELCEAKEIAKTMNAIFEADKNYNIIKSMEEGDISDIEMTWEEFIVRFKNMWENSEAKDKMVMKTEILKLLS